jgi:hypothetical protein
MSIMMTCDVVIGGGGGMTSVESGESEPDLSMAKWLNALIVHKCVYNICYTNTVCYIFSYIHVVYSVLGADWLRV